MSEKILVLGAGIAGLGAAMALGGGSAQVILLDRDPPPPDAAYDEAFQHWERKGVVQLRHSHVFLGKLFALIRDRHPRLLAMLTEAGVREMTIRDGLPYALRDGYAPAPGDEDLSILFSRRTTLELVMRRYALTLPGVTFVTEALVRGLIFGERRNGARVVEGVRVERGGVLEEMRANVVVDATGRTTIMPDLLRAEGCAIAEEESPAGILYYTRHYRLREDKDEPARGEIPSAGDLGYIKYGIFPADHRHFSLTLAVPEIENEIRKNIVYPETFDRIASLIPGAGRWTDLTRAEPVSKVYSMGNLKSLWRSYAKDGAPEVLNFFAIGDAAVRTNPLYGRGCSASVTHAHALAEILNATRDPAARARAFDARTRFELRAHWSSMVKQDAAAIRRAKNEQDPHYRPRFKARLIKSLTEDAIGPATRGDIAVFRALMRPFHMLEHPAVWLKRPGILARILWMWMKPRAWKQHLAAPVLGPARAAMLEKLGLRAT